MSFKKLLYCICVVVFWGIGLGTVWASDYRSPSFIVRDPVIGANTIETNNSAPPTNQAPVINNSVSKTPTTQKQEDYLVIVVIIVALGLGLVVLKIRRNRSTGVL